MHHRDLIKSLTQTQRAALTEKSNRAGLFHLIPHASFIVVLAALIALKLPYWPLLMPILGILIVFLFTLLHEAIHRTVFKTVAMNDAVAWVCGLALGLGPTWFRYFHFAHHRHTQDPEKDPELAAPKPKTRLQYCVHVSGIPVWKSHIQTLFRNAFGMVDYDYVPSSARPTVVKEARIMLLVYTALAVLSVLFGTAILIWVWLVPALFGQPFLRLYLLAEHADCAENDNMLANTRTTLTTWFMRRLAWNMPYHAEHHAFPTVPFHRLPQLHEITAQYLETTENGYASFNKTYVGNLREPEALR